MIFFGEIIVFEDFFILEIMRVWVLGGFDEFKLIEKVVFEFKCVEVLVCIDVVVICVIDLEILYYGMFVMVEGEDLFNKDFMIGYEYMGIVVVFGLGVDEYVIGEWVLVEIYVGCG